LKSYFYKIHATHVGLFLLQNKNGCFYAKYNEPLYFSSGRIISNIVICDVGQ